MRPKPLPPASMSLRDGVAPSHISLAQPGWDTVLAFLCDRFPAQHRDVWLARMQRGDVCTQSGERVDENTPYRLGTRIFYYRDVGEEPRLAADFTIVHSDEHLLVVDKPHFLPVIPTGKYVRECLLSRLKAKTGNAELSPLHRLDRDTAGLVVFACQQATRSAYQSLFATRAVTKVYEAIAANRNDLSFPLTYKSRIERDTQFFRSCEVNGEPNSETRIEKLESNGEWARYRLHAITGKKHQLRLHMANLGIPIRNDSWYPVVKEPIHEPLPLQLLAQQIAFYDPVYRCARHFTTTQTLSLD